MRRGHICFEYGASCHPMDGLIQGWRGQFESSPPPLGVLVQAGLDSLLPGELQQDRASNAGMIEQDPCNHCVCPQDMTLSSSALEIVEEGTGHKGVRSNPVQPCHSQISCRLRIWTPAFR